MLKIYFVLYQRSSKNNRERVRGESQYVNKLVLCCGGRFRSRRGLAVHSCSRRSKYHPARSEVSAEGVMCGVCGRNFRRPGDMKKHKCREERGQSGGRPDWFCVVQTVPEMAQEC